MGDVRLNITGMTCGHCVAAVKKALEAVPGVQMADVNLERKEGVVKGHAAPESLIKAVENEGYEAEILT
jgi:copper chaperone